MLAAITQQVAAERITSFSTWLKVLARGWKRGRLSIVGSLKGQDFFVSREDSDETLIGAKL